MERTHKHQPPLHDYERWILGLVSLELVWLAWAFGGVRVWGIIPGAILAVAAFVTALLPRDYSGESSGRGAYRLHSWPRLLKFPLFWLGLTLLAYLGVQAMNPSWCWETSGKMWWMRKVDDIAWLPTSAEAPFLRFNIWRMVLIYGTAWLTVCALWIGVTRRRTLHLLLSILAGNALVLTLAGIVRAVQGVTAILWLLPFDGAYGFGSFIYHNHGAAYVDLLAMSCLGLAAWYHQEGARRMSRSSPALVWLLGTLVLGLGVAYATSRAGLGLLTLFLVVAAVVYYFTGRTDAVRTDLTPMAVKVSLFVVIAGCFGFVVLKSDLSALALKFAYLQRDGAKEESYHDRVLVRERVERMLADHWVRGTGAGSFRYVFTPYIRDSKSLFDGGHNYWEHAHIDWLEIPIEEGIVGTLLMVAAFGWCVWRWLRGGGWWHPVGLMLMLGALQTLAHAGIDFPFQCPAILITWWALLVVALRWIELDGSAQR